MKSVLSRTALPLCALTVLAACVLGGNVYAQEGKGDAGTVTPDAAQTVPAEDTADPAQEAAPPQEAVGGAGYTFVAAPGDSLSVFVRKAIQLYDGEREDLSLSPEQSIFSETMIVQRMGSPLLEVGQSVTVQRSLVEEFANAATQLPAERLDRWKAYSDATDFDIPAVTPAEPAAPAETENTQDEADDQTDQEENGEQAQDTDQQNQNNNDGAPWYWWLVGAGTLGVLYYLLSGSRRPREEK